MTPYQMAKGAARDYGEIILPEFDVSKFEKIL
jgi:hypothetical protein